MDWASTFDRGVQIAPAATATALIVVLLRLLMAERHNWITERAAWQQERSELIDQHQEERAAWQAERQELQREHRQRLDDLQEQHRRILIETGADLARNIEFLRERVAELEQTLRNRP